MVIRHKPLPYGRERSLYLWGAAIAALLVFTGFARTYYLKGFFGAPSLSWLLHVHGLVMTIWFALFVVQVWLVAERRTLLHQRLGIFGAIWALLVLGVGAATAVEAARRGSTPGPPPLVFLSIPLGTLLVFAVLLALGLFFRRSRDVHKRLMLLSTLGILTPAFARIPLEFVRTGGPPVFFILTDLCILACVTFDTIRNRRLHRAFLWGTLLIVLSQPLRLWFASTPAWISFAKWLVG